MAQGLKKHAGGQRANKAYNSAKNVKRRMQDMKVKKGSSTKEPNKYTDESLADHSLTRAIDKANEQKVAAKLIQDGGRVKLTDVMKVGKDLNREKRRDLVKKKLTRVEDKLKTLRAKAEMEGKLA